MYLTDNVENKAHNLAITALLPSGPVTIHSNTSDGPTLHKQEEALLEIFGVLRDPLRLDFS